MRTDATTLLGILVTFAACEAQRREPPAAVQPDAPVARGAEPVQAEPAPDVEPARGDCQSDEDCALLTVDCSPCKCPGPLPAVSKLWLEYERKRCASLGHRRAPDDVQCSCPAPGDESTWPTRAVCIRGRCEPR